MVVHARRNRIVAVLPSAKKRSNETLAEFIDRFRVHFRYHRSSKHEEKEREEKSLREIFAYRTSKVIDFNCLAT